MAKDRDVLPTKEQILYGRRAVEAYRKAHSQLHSKPWHKGVSEEHTPLSNKLLAEFRKQGFTSLQDFWDTNKRLNIRELGFASEKDFEARATAKDRQALWEMWR